MQQVIYIFLSFLLFFCVGKQRYLATANQMYNLKMHGVDQADAFLQRHLAKHKNSSWKKTAFFGISKIAVDNMYLIWNLLFPKTKKHQELNLTEFLIQLALDLAPTPSSSPFSSSSSSTFSAIPCDYLYYKHLEGKYVGKKGRCVVCKDYSCTFRCICNCWVHEKCYFKHK